MKEITIIKENISKIKAFLEKEQINYEILQEPLRKFKRVRPAKVDIFSDYGEAIKDKELETEKRLLEEADEEEEFDEYEE